MASQIDCAGHLDLAMSKAKYYYIIIIIGIIGI